MKLLLQTGDNILLEAHTSPISLLSSAIKKANSRHCGERDNRIEDTHHLRLRALRRWQSLTHSNAQINQARAEALNITVVQQSAGCAPGCRAGAFASLSFMLYFQHALECGFLSCTRFFEFQPVLPRWDFSFAPSRTYYLKGSSFPVASDRHRADLENRFNTTQRELCWIYLFLFSRINGFRFWGLTWKPATSEPSIYSKLLNNFLTNSANRPHKVTKFDLLCGTSCYKWNMCLGWIISNWRPRSSPDLISLIQLTHPQILIPHQTASAPLHWL